MSDDLEPKQDYNPSDLLDSILSKKDDELLPWQDITLPSKGHYYDGGIPGGVVEVRPMGLYADKALATSRLVKTGKAMDYIFEHCIRLPNGFDQMDLLADDRAYLLFLLRGITHGHEYDFLLKCPYCKEHSQHEYDFNDLWGTMQHPVLDENDIPIQEPFKVVLPYLSKLVSNEFWVTIRFLRGRDTMDFLGATSPKNGMPQRARTRKKRHAYDAVKDRAESVDETLEKNINRVIVSAMGDEDRGKIQALVNRLHSEDIATITEWLKVNTPGIDTSIETDCPHCNSLIICPLPITESFFRPKKRKLSRE